MSGRVPFDQVISSLNDTMFDDAHWPAASALIDRVCGSKGNILFWGDGGADTPSSIRFVRCVYRGERFEEFEKEYFRVYYPLDERVPRLRQLPDSEIVSIEALYTDEEKRTSIAYNEMLQRSDTSNCLHARLDGPTGSRIIWTAADPVDDAGWTAGRVDAIARVLPHIRQLVRVRRALADAGALEATMAQLLGSARCGVIQLDPRGRIVALNDRARKRLRARDGLMDARGRLHARMRGEDPRLQALIAKALPGGTGGAACSSTMAVTRPLGLPPRLVLHVTPIRGRQPGWGAARVAAIVLVVEPEKRTMADPELIAKALGLTAAESRVAALLAEGHTPRDIAAATGRSTGTVRWHVRQIFDKNGIARQAELVHLVRTLSAFSPSRD